MPHAGHFPHILELLETYDQNLGSGWATEGYLAGATAGDILADTGQLPAGKYDFVVCFVGNPATPSLDAELQHRNVANDTTIKGQRIPLALGMFYFVTIYGHELAVNERMRVEAIAAIAGAYLQVSIFWVRRQ